MNVNVTKFEIKFCESGSIEVILSNDHMAKQEYYKQTGVYITQKELPLFLACMKGESEFYPFFSDISYLLRVYPDGFHYVRLSSGHDGNGSYREEYFTFPNKLLENLHSLILGQIDNPSDNTYVLSTDHIAHYTGLVKPRFTWVYNHRKEGKWVYDENHTFLGSKYEEWIADNLQESIEKYSAMYPSLQAALEGLERIASNYSVFGENVTIDLYFDGLPKNTIPDSYYFNIHLEDKRIMNGGIIFHPDYGQDNFFQGSYSTHT